MQGVFAAPPERVQATPERVGMFLRSKEKQQLQAGKQQLQASGMQRKFSPELQRALHAHFEKKRKQLRETRIFFGPTADNEVTQLQEKITDLEKQIDLLKQDKELRDKKIADLEQQIAKADADKRSQSDEMASLKQEKNAELKDAKSKIEVLEKEVKRVFEELVIKQEEVTDQKQTRELLKNLEEMLGKISEKKDDAHWREITLLSETLRSVQRDLSISQRELEAYRQENQVLKERVILLSSSRKTEEASTPAVRQEDPAVGSLEKKKNMLKEQEIQLETTIAGLKVQKEELEKRIYGMKVSDVVLKSTYYLVEELAFCEDDEIMNILIDNMTKEWNIPKEDQLPASYMRMATHAACFACADYLIVERDNYLQKFTDDTLEGMQVARAPEKIDRPNGGIWFQIFWVIWENTQAWVLKNQKDLTEKLKAEKVDDKTMISKIWTATQTHMKTQEFINTVYDNVMHDAEAAAAKKHEDEDVKSGKKKARELDKEYARLVAGAIQAQSVSQVWGPLDGVLLNSAETRQMQDDLYSELAAAAAEEDRGGRKRGGASVRLLAEEARRKRLQFNEGWNNGLEVGILPAVVHSETRILDILVAGRLVPARIQQSIPTAAAGEDATTMQYIRLLRRHELTRTHFASAVGLNMVSISMTKPTARPTRVQAYQACASARALIQALVDRLNRGEVVHALVQDAKAKNFLTADYNKP